MADNDKDKPQVTLTIDGKEVTVDKGTTILEAAAKIGIDIIRASSPTLMDQAAIPPDALRQVALSVPGVLVCHKARSRGHETASYVDLHIQVAPNLSVARGHGIAHEVGSVEVISDGVGYKVRVGR